MLSKPSAPSSLARASGREHYATRMKREIKELKVLNTLLMNRLLTYNDEAVINLTSASSQPPAGEEGSPDDDNNEEPDDEGDDDDPDDEPSNPEDDITSPVGFKILINFNDVDHLFILDHSERTVEELKFAVMGRLGVPWHNIELTPFGADQALADDRFVEDPVHYLEGALDDENVNNFDPLAFFNVGFQMEVDVEPLPMEHFNQVEVVQQFNQRRTFSLTMFVGANDEHFYNCITCYLVEKTHISAHHIKLDGNVDHTRVEFSIRALGGGKRANCKTGASGKNRDDALMSSEDELEAICCVIRQTPT